MIALSGRGKYSFLAVALALIVITNGLAYWAILGLRDSNKWVDHTREAQAKLAELVADIFDAEASVRAYIMTGEERNLEPYLQASIHKQPDAVELRNLIADNAEQLKRLDRLEPLIKNRWQVLAAMVQTYKDGGLSAVSARDWRRSSDSLRRPIREIADAISAEEDRLHVLRRQAETISASRLLLFQIAIGFFSFALVGTLFYLLFAESRRLRSANAKLQNVNAEIETQVRQRTQELDRAVMELRASEVRLRGFLAASPDAMIIVDQTSRILLASHWVQAMFGYAPEELVGQPIGVLLPERYRDIHADHLRHYMMAPKGRNMGAGRNLYALRKDGSEFPVEISLNPDRSGETPAVIAAVRDITERKSVEKQLQQAQKIEAIGNLTGGMAHDFNNLLSIMIGNLDMLRGQLKDGARLTPEVDQFSGAALEAALRGADLTQRLLAFARRQPLLPARIDVNELVTRMGKLMGRTLGEDIEIKLDLGEKVWPVVADPAQLDASLVNIFNNARDAMPGGGVLTISTYSRHLDEDYAAAHPELAPGDYAVIEVSDTGTGIAPEALSQIFEPFFTTKEQGKGTGLGLSMVFGFIKQSGGHINVYSEAGHGTTLRLYLPRATAATDAAAKLATPAIERGGRETILAVEDNAELRRVVVRQLTDLGYRVLEADHAAAAVKTLESQPVDLLFTDIVIPGGVNGYDLARSAAARWPEMKVLLTSGFPEAKLNGNGGPPLNMRLLVKPYRKEDLARALREILDAN